MEKLITPLGEIRVYTDGVSTGYPVSPYHSQIRSLRENPPAGCWQIKVPAKTCKTISCVLVPDDDTMENFGSSGERFYCSEFAKDNVNLVIGAEGDHPSFDTRRLRFGMEYVLNAPVEEVSFGVAWVADYEGADDIRAYLAADQF